MTTSEKPIVFHCPNTRSSALMLLVEELGADVEVRTMSLKKAEHRAPDYLAVNPLGKVPAIVHHGQLITETVACLLYLAELHPKSGLSPAIGDPLRGPYLRWMAFYGAAFEPAIVDASMKREPSSSGISPYGTFDGMLKVVTDQLAKGPYILGDRFTAADVLWGTGLTWTTGFKLVPETPEIKSYLATLAKRPALSRHRAREAERAAHLDA
jgi:glutathione S-transferase